MQFPWYATLKSCFARNTTMVSLETWLAPSIFDNVSWTLQEGIVVAMTEFPKLAPFDTRYGVESVISALCCSNVATSWRVLSCYHCGTTSDRGSSRTVV